MALKFSLSDLVLLSGISFFASCSKKNNVSPSAPFVSSFTPSSGIKGSLVEISGAHFGASAVGDMVTFNGIAATVVSASDTNLVVTVPAGAGVGKIRVQTVNGADSSAGDFIYIPIVSTLAGDGKIGFKDGADSTAEFSNNIGIAVDASGNLYVGDFGNQRVRKITPEGIVGTLAGDGSPGFVNAAGASSEFNGPAGVAADAAGNVYVADYSNNRIRKITAGGAVSTLAGNGTSGFSGDGGPATAAAFHSPVGVAADASGNIYVADINNLRIRKITSAGIVSTLAGNGNPGFSGDGGPGTAAEFKYPYGIAADAAGNLYVGDEENNRIRKITPAGVVSTFAGDGNAGYINATGAAAEFNTPTGIAVDASGNVYVADRGNNRIRKITPTGVVSTLAGNGTGAFKDGIGTDAEFNGPIGVAVDASGTVYVSDNNGNRIRKIQ